MTTLAKVCPYCQSLLVKTISLTSGKKRGKKNKMHSQSGEPVYTCFHCGLSITSLTKYPNNVDLYIAGKRILNWNAKFNDIKKPVYKYNTESYFLENHRVEGYVKGNTSVCYKCKNPTKKMEVYHNGAYFTSHRCIVCGSVMFDYEVFKAHREKIKLLNVDPFINGDNKGDLRPETGIDKNAIYFNQLDDSKRSYISRCLSSSDTRVYSVNTKNFANDDKQAEQLKFYLAKCIVKTGCKQIYSYFSLERNGESLKFYFIDTPKYDMDSVDVTDKYPSIKSLLAKELFVALANGKQNVTIDGKFVYNIVEYAIFKPYPYVHHLQKRKVVSAVERIPEVYVYYKLNMPCISKQHSVESVTLITKDFRNNGTVRVNAFYCKTCKRYFINYEALQELYDKNRYPIFHFIFADTPSNDLYLNKVSKLGSCGYSVRQGGLSEDQRHRLLKWIIDNGILSKAEIISNIEFFISYHGKQEKNKNAVTKWQEDIQFVSRYVSDNRRSIRTNHFK